MSSIETHYIRLKKVELQTSLDDWMLERMNVIGCEVYPEYDIFKNYTWRAKDDKNYRIINDNVYKVVQHIEFEEDDTLAVIDHGDDEFSIVTSFYNGGACLDEILDEILK